MELDTSSPSVPVELDLQHSNQRVDTEHNQENCSATTSSRNQKDIVHDVEMVDVRNEGPAQNKILPKNEAFTCRTVKDEDISSTSKDIASKLKSISWQIRPSHPLISNPLSLTSFVNWTPREKPLLAPFNAPHGSSTVFRLNQRIYDEAVQYMFKTRKIRLHVSCKTSWRGTKHFLSLYSQLITKCEIFIKPHFDSEARDVLQEMVKMFGVNHAIKSIKIRLKHGVKFGPVMQPVQSDGRTLSQILAIEPEEELCSCYHYFFNRHLVFHAVPNQTFLLEPLAGLYGIEEVNFSGCIHPTFRDELRSTMMSKVKVELPVFVLNPFIGLFDDEGLLFPSYQWECLKAIVNYDNVPHEDIGEGTHWP
ncbi:hypothetical protein M501DRAFT_996607 [Patellaria atrata CBS 101060]|uniref:Uncharacterized protein n=1 Tax=Patellaria atrata CBS 101060 TaxID=1346257 RepID=A0A9P4S766_9PEZI|nr:hypothetical protein M501DRAFT_996607 [Patellaria atrata CBS 101060]